MKERPILFSGEMVRAILAGRKTQTRRFVKPQPEIVDKEPRYQKNTWAFWSDDVEKYRNGLVVECPYGKPGDRLWVRETFCVLDSAVVGHDQFNKVIYRADGGAEYRSLDKIWKPSIHMPRWASRIFLEISGVRVERLKDISEDDAEKEGAEIFDAFEPHKFAFKRLWESLSGPDSWESNPWVWAIEFKQVDPRL